MRIALFTSNQPRHIALIEALASIADELLVVQECNTVFPGRVQDFFGKSPVMQDYFSRVIAAEQEVFARPRFTPANVRTLPIKMGDLNQLDLQSLSSALQTDVCVVFGASFIRGELCRHLVERRAVNIHMGVSPYYRGSSTNFWAMYDGRIDMVGATIHRLSGGLDSGDMLYHALPAPAAVDPFVFGMRAVRAAQQSLLQHLQNSTLDSIQPVVQDRSRQLRYTRNADFTDAAAAEYLQRLPSATEIEAGAKRRDLSNYLRPVIG